MKRMMTLIGVLAAAGLVCVQCGAGPGPTTPPTAPGRRNRSRTPRRATQCPPHTAAGDLRRSRRHRLVRIARSRPYRQAAGRHRRDGVCRRRQRVYAGHRAAVPRLLRTRMGPAQGADVPGARQSRVRIAGAAPYFDYFGTNAVNNGPPRQGYYSFPLGNWHAISLNSNIDVGEGSPQGRWLLFDLASNPSKCTIAYWHHPLFSSGQNGDNPGMRRCGASCTPPASTSWWSGTITCTSGSPRKTRMAVSIPRAASASSSPAQAARNLYNFVTVRANSERRISAFGVLKLTLEFERYDWEFIPVSGVGDRGSDVSTRRISCQLSARRVF